MRPGPRGDAAHRPRVVIVVVNYNGGHYLSRCLDSLEIQTFRQTRTIVVDNASVDGSADGLERRYPGIDLIRSATNLGFAAGNNLAFRHAPDVEFYALLNPDAVAEPDWLERLVAAADAHSEYALFGCRMLADATGARLDGVGDVYHVSGLPWRDAHGAPASGRELAQREIFAPSGAAALYRAAVVADTEGFDPSFFCYLEDVDLGFRARLAGHRALYVPDAVVVHEGSAIVGRHSDFQLYYGHRNLVWTFIRNMPGPLLWRYLPLHLLMNVATVVAYALQGRAGVMFRSKRDALRGLRACLAKRHVTQSARVTSVDALRAAMRGGLLAPLRRRAPREP